MIEKIIKNSPSVIDLNCENQQKQLFQAAQQILEQKKPQEMDAIEKRLIEKKDLSLTFVLLALKMAKSKYLALNRKNPLFVSIVFAIYKEHNRIKKPSEHPHGENFLLQKIEQMEWLFGENPNLKWECIIVDDGCPENSGAIAQNIVRENHLSEKVRVLYLENAIAKQYSPVRYLSNTSESQKGGSICYGMWAAVQKKIPQEHIVVYTDADLSTHLSQTMLLINPILKEKKLASIGSRRENTSVVIKQQKRNNRGKLFIYLWKRLLPNLPNIIDTQCGFKAFQAEMVPYLTEDLVEKKFAFDIELLVKTALRKDASIAKVPIAWIDSEAASTTSDLQPYLSMLKSILKMCEKYFPKSIHTNPFAHFIAELDEARFQTLLENIPDEITKQSPDAFTKYDKIKVSDLNKILSKK